MVARLFDELPVDYERGLLDKRKCWTGFTYRLDTLTDIRRVRRSNSTAFSRAQIDLTQPRLYKFDRKPRPNKPRKRRLSLRS